MINNLEKCGLGCERYSAYDYDGLSLQELLCQFFTKINECIDDVNKYTEMVKEVINWIRNEGLEKEVRKVLQEWLAEGKFKEIIEGEIFQGFVKDLDKRVRFYPTIAAMQADLEIPEGASIITQGYYKANDGGGAEYIKSNSQFEIVLKDYVTPEMFGAVGDNVTDDTEAIRKALKTNKPIIGSKEKTYVFNNHVGLYDSTDIYDNILIKGGTFRIDGKLDFRKDLIITDSKIVGNPHFTVKKGDYIGEHLIIENNIFDVGELTFRINDTDIKTLTLKNNDIKFYGAFLSTTTSTKPINKGNIYVIGNKCSGKTVDDHSESYYAVCVCENEYIEFANNTCRDFITHKPTASVHDGYFSCLKSYIHDNVVINLDGSREDANSILKSKNDGYKYYYNNYYEITSNNYFPIIQAQTAGANWIIENCIFKVNKAGVTQITAANITFKNCIFDMNEAKEEILKNEFNLINCKIKLARGVKNLFAIKKGIIKDCEITITDNVKFPIKSYSDAPDAVIDNTRCNVHMTEYFTGLLKDCILQITTDVQLPVLEKIKNCTFLPGSYFVTRAEPKVDIIMARYKDQTKYIDKSSGQISENDLIMRYTESNKFSITIKNVPSIIDMQ